MWIRNRTFGWKAQFDQKLKDEASDDNRSKFIHHSSERHIQLKYQTQTNAAIFPYSIIVVCIQNDVVSRYMKSMNNFKTKWDIKNISTGFLIIQQCNSFGAIKIFTSDHL